MNDEYVNKGKVAASVAWAGVIGLMTAAWVAMILGTGDAWKYAGMLAASSCALSAFAAVLHIRCYAVRVAGLVRASANLHRSGDGDRPRPVSHL